MSTFHGLPMTLRSAWPNQGFRNKQYSAEIGEEKGARPFTSAIGLANTSFVGIPMIEAFFGRNQIGIGLLSDQLVGAQQLGVPIAGLYSSGPGTPADLLKRIISLSPLIALTVALLQIPVDVPA